MEYAVSVPVMESEKPNPSEVIEKTRKHPCYNCASHTYARMHLPIAPRCNVQCNYCVRKFDCPNESRPGVTTKVLTPLEAFEKYKYIKSKMPNLTVVGIAGPGDALANFDETRKVLTLIREYDHEVTFCLSTNGLMLPHYALELIGLGVTHVTVTMNAVDPHIAGQIYKYIDYMDMRFEGDSAGAIILTNQLNGLRYLVSQGIICKVNIVVLKGINDQHIPQIVETVRDLGCYITNIMPFIPVEGSIFEHYPAANNKEVNRIRKQCEQIMPQMYHCKQCRADAVGTLDDDQSLEYANSAKTEKTVTSINYRFAIASKDGILVDRHFGHVNKFYIYEYTNEKAVFLETRAIEKYCNEPNYEADPSIEEIAKVISDCDGVIAMRIGESPKKQLKARNITVFATFDKIEAAITDAADKMNCRKEVSAK